MSYLFIHQNGSQHTAENRLFPIRVVTRKGIWVEVEIL